MIGKITDGIGLQYCVPIDVFVRHHYNVMLYSQLEDCLRNIYALGFEKDIDYIKEKINVDLPVKLREAKNEKATLEQRRDLFKANAEWKEGKIDKLLNKLKNSNKVEYIEYAAFRSTINNRMFEATRQAQRVYNYELEDKLKPKYNEEKEEEKENYKRELKALTNEIITSLANLKQDLKENMTRDKYTKIREGAENTARKVSIFDKDDDRFKKIKERHRLSKLYLSLLLEKTKAEASKCTDLDTKEEAKKLFNLSIARQRLLRQLNGKYKENDIIRVQCMELQERVNNIFNHLCKSKLMKVINDLREQEAKAEEKYNEAYTKWDIISDNRATLMGNLHKLTTDIINLKGECVQLQMRIDFCNTRNPFLERISKETLGLDYL